MVIWEYLKCIESLKIPTIQGFWVPNPRLIIGPGYSWWTGKKSNVLNSEIHPDWWQFWSEVHLWILSFFEADNLWGHAEDKKGISWALSQDFDTHGTRMFGSLYSAPVWVVLARDQTCWENAPVRHTTAKTWFRFIQKLTRIHAHPCANTSTVIHMYTRTHLNTPACTNISM